MAATTVWESCSIDTASELIQLRYFCQKHYEFVEHCSSGSVFFDPTTMTQMFANKIKHLLDKLQIGTSLIQGDCQDPEFLSQTIQAISHRLDQLQQEFEDKHNLYAANVEADQVLESMRGGILKLQDNAQLINPFTILKLEKAWQLEETGNLGHLVENWNKQYYSRLRCQEFNSDPNFFLKIIRFGDIDAFVEYLPRMLDTMEQFLILFQIAEHNQLDMLKIALDRIEVDDNNKFNSLIMSALSSSQSAVEIVKFLFQRFPQYVCDPVQLMTHTCISEGHDDNIRYFLYLPEINDAILDQILSRLTGNPTLFMEAYHHPARAEHVRPEIIHQCFYSAVAFEHYQVADFLLPQIGADFHFRDLMLQLMEFACDDSGTQSLKYFVNIPEVTGELILEVFNIESMFTNVKRRIVDEILDIVRQSGKVAPEALEGF